MSVLINAEADARISFSENLERKVEVVVFISAEDIFWIVTVHNRE